jgi:hypothetical protein
MDQFCLLFDPESETCVKNFGFFTFDAWNNAVNFGISPYLGLAPTDKINGPSFVESLNKAGKMLNFSVSWQFGNWE